MIHKAIVSAATALFTFGGVAAAIAAPAAAATPSWKLSYFDHTRGSYLGAVSISSTHNAWGVGRLPQVSRWNGSSWHAVTSPNFHTKNYVFYNAVSTASASDTWIGGDTSTTGGTFIHAVAAHWYRGKWYNHVLSKGGDITKISVFASNDVWLLGTVGNAGAYWHWNGKAWSQGTLAASPSRSNDPHWVGATSAGGKGVLLHYVSGHWHAVTSLHVALPKNASTYYVGDVVQRAANDVYVAVGFRIGIPPHSTTYTGLSLYHWNGHTWTRVIHLPQDSPESMTNDGFGGLWILSSYSYGDDRVIDIRSGKIVHARKMPNFGVNTLYAVQLTLRPGTRTLWAVGYTEVVNNDTDIRDYAAIGSLGVN